MDRHIYRIIDANINRAMEGLRVCEDILRFGTDSDSSVKFKKFRHLIAGLRKILPENNLLDSRDVQGDNRKFFDLESEKKRFSIEDIFTKNIHRVIEAVRTLEEFVKIFDDIDSTQIEKIRFSLYELEKEITLSLSRNNKKNMINNSLYAIMDSAFIDDGTYAETALKLIRSGVSIIQLRMKNISRKKILENALTVNKLCSDNGVLFIVNDYADIAYISDADGLHIGQDDISVSDARKVLRSDKIVGLSTHSREEIVDAMNQKCDYIAFGPVFTTKSKTGIKIDGVGLDLFNSYNYNSGIPLVAIGGIKKENINIIKETGCNCFAVISALYKDNTIIDNCINILKEINDSNR